MKLIEIIKDHSEKISAKRFWGAMCFICALITYMLDGFNFYNINEHLFDSLLIAATTLLGLDVAKHFKKNDKLTKDTE